MTKTGESHDIPARGDTGTGRSAAAHGPSVVGGGKRARTAPAGRHRHVRRPVRRRAGAVAHALVVRPSRLASVRPRGVRRDRGRSGDRRHQLPHVAHHRATDPVRRGLRLLRTWGAAPGPQVAAGARPDAGRAARSMGLGSGGRNPGGDRLRAVADRLGRARQLPLPAPAGERDLLRAAGVGGDRAGRGVGDSAHSASHCQGSRSAAAGGSPGARRPPGRHGWDRGDRDCPW